MITINLHTKSYCVWAQFKRHCNIYLMFYFLAIQVFNSFTEKLNQWLMQFYWRKLAYGLVGRLKLIPTRLIEANNNYRKGFPLHLSLKWRLTKGSPLSAMLFINLYWRNTVQTAVLCCFKYLLITAGTALSCSISKRTHRNTEVVNTWNQKKVLIQRKSK